MLQSLQLIQNLTGEEQRKSAQLIIRQFEEKLEKFKDNLQRITYNK